MQTSSAIPSASLFGHYQTNTAVFILLSCTMHCTFHCVFSLSDFHVSLYHFYSKTNGVNETILLCFVNDWPSVTSASKL